MARKEDRKKQKKRLHEKKTEARHRQHLASQRPSLYPNIVINADCADPAFRKAAGQAAESFSYKDDACCPPEIREHYLRVAKIGWRQWYESVRVQIRDTHDELAGVERAVQKVTLPVMLHFGIWLFQHLPTQYTTRFSPDHFFRIDNVGNFQIVSFTLMGCVTEGGKRLYTPQCKPTVCMNGVVWQLVLYSHALERLCSRLVPDGTLTYEQCIDVYYRFDHDMLQFTPAALADGQEAVRVEFNVPLCAQFHEEYATWARAVLELPESHKFSEEGDWMMVLGYLPLHIQGKYARAKTFLLPGFFKTPEYELCRAKARTPAERRLLHAMTDEGRRVCALERSNIEAIRWYHNHGVPQIFDRSSGSRR